MSFAASCNAALEILERRPAEQERSLREWNDFRQALLRSISQTIDDLVELEGRLPTGGALREMTAEQAELRLRAMARRYAKLMELSGWDADMFDLRVQLLAEDHSAAVSKLRETVTGVVTAAQLETA